VHRSGRTAGDGGGLATSGTGQQEGAPA
jgi:hypothetical protein